MLDFLEIPFRPFATRPPTNEARKLFLRFYEYHRLGRFGKSFDSTFVSLFASRYVTRPYETKVVPIPRRRALSIPLGASCQDGPEHVMALRPAVGEEGD